MKKQITFASNGNTSSSTSTAPPVRSSAEINGGAVVNKKVKVIVRARPMLPQEMGDSKVVNINEGSKIVTLRDPKNTSEEHHFEFDTVYDSQCTQLDLFTQEIQPVLSSLLEGYNTTVFCYGVTGSGKTFTMQGDVSSCSEEDLQKPNSKQGIVPRTVHHLFQMINQKKEEQDVEFLAEGSFLEIYNEKIYDLLEIKEKGIPIREDPQKNIILQNLKTIPFADYTQFMQFYATGCRNRSVGFTKMNEFSSRGHACLILTIKYRKPDTQKWTVGKLHLIDLAGSEDNRKTDNKGQRMTESNHINLSLFVLKKVVNALNTGTSRVPYRDSKLTRILQDSLGGSSQAVMIVNVSPTGSQLQNTYNALHFAMKSKQIVNNPIQNTAIISGAQSEGVFDDGEMEAKMKLFKKNNPSATATENRSRSASKQQALKRMVSAISSNIQSKMQRTSSAPRSMYAQYTGNQPQFDVNMIHREVLKVLEQMGEKLLSPHLKKTRAFEEKIQERLEKLENNLKKEELSKMKELIMSMREEEEAEGLDGQESDGSEYEEDEEEHQQNLYPSHPHQSQLQQQHFAQPDYMLQENCDNTGTFQFSNFTLNTTIDNGNNNNHSVFQNSSPSQPSNTFDVEKSYQQFASQQAKTEAPSVVEIMSPCSKRKTARYCLKQGSIFLRDKNYPMALHFMEQAQTLLPNNESLKEKIQKVKRKIQKNSDHSSSFNSSGSKEDDSMDMDEGDVLESNTKQFSSNNALKTVNQNTVPQYQFNPVQQTNYSFSQVANNKENVIPQFTTKTLTQLKPVSMSSDQKIIHFLNNATFEQLQDLYSIGEKKAEKVMQERPFGSISDLKRLGMSQKSVESLFEKNEPVIDSLCSKHRIMIQ